MLIIKNKIVFLTTRIKNECYEYQRKNHYQSFKKRI